MTMRILHVVPYYVPAWRYGGPIKSVHGLCKGLASLGHDVHVFTTNIDGPADSEVVLDTPVLIDGVKVWYFASKNMRRLHWSPTLTRALGIHLPTFDVVHLHTIYLWPTTAAAHVARRAGIPYVLAPRGMLVGDLINGKNRWVKKAWIACFEKRNLAHAAAVHFTSGIEAEQAAKLGIVPKAACIVANGLDVDEIAAADPGRQTDTNDVVGNEPFLLFIGRVNWEKGLDRLIRALPGVANCRLIVAGNDDNGYQQKLEGIALERGVAHRISFIGPVYGAQKAALLRQASALVLPSYSENFGNVVLESMAAGCPVIVTPEVGAAEVVRQTGGGTVLHGSPEALAAGINAMLADPEKLREIGKRAHSAIATRFTWTAIAAEMDRIYRGIVSGRTADAGANPAPVEASSK